MNSRAYKNKSLVEQVQAGLKEGEVLVGPRPGVSKAHAEENLLYYSQNVEGVSPLKQVEVSNPICQQCEELLKKNGVESTTVTSGRPSRSRQNQTSSNQLDLFKKQ